MMNQIQTLQEAPAFSSLENLELAGSPGPGHGKHVGRLSGAASKRTCVSSDLVTIRFSEFTGFWPGHKLASPRRPAGNAFAGEGAGSWAVSQWTLNDDDSLPLRENISTEGYSTFYSLH